MVCSRAVCTPLALSLTCSRLRPPTWAARASATTDIISTVTFENRPLGRAKPKVKQGEWNVKPMVSMLTREVIMFNKQLLAQTETKKIVRINITDVMLLTWLATRRALAMTRKVVYSIVVRISVLR